MELEFKFYINTAHWEFKKTPHFYKSKKLYHLLFPFFIVYLKTIQEF